MNLQCEGIFSFTISWVRKTAEKMLWTNVSNFMQIWLYILIYIVNIIIADNTPKSFDTVRTRKNNNNKNNNNKKKTTKILIPGHLLGLHIIAPNN